MTSRTPLASLAFAALLLAAAPALAGDDDDRARTVSVSGHGEVAAAPDTAEVTAGVLTEAPDAAAALAENSAAVARLFAALDRFGIAARDRQTAGFSVSPRYERPPRGGTGDALAGYQVSNRLTVRVRDLDRLGALLDALVGAGANQMHGIRFYVDEADALADEARRRAMADARRKAALLAEAAGARLGRVLDISEAGAPSPRSTMRAMAQAAPASVPVATGEQSVGATVSVTYALE